MKFIEDYSNAAGDPIRSHLHQDLCVNRASAWSSSATHPISTVERIRIHWGRANGSLSLKLASPLVGGLNFIVANLNPALTGLALHSGNDNEINGVPGSYWEIYDLVQLMCPCSLGSKN